MRFAAVAAIDPGGAVIAGFMLANGPTLPMVSGFPGKNDFWLSIGTAFSRGV
jgi:hypothetical protein